MPILAFFPRCLLFGAWFCIPLLSGSVWSAELGQAKVSAILRDVQKTEGSKTEPAAVGDVIAGGGKITTQGQSLAELKFPDGSVIRIGNNSTFSFDPNDRTVRLDRGTALVSTPPKAEGINIVSGGVSGTVGGDPAGKTFLVTAYPAEGGGAKGTPTGGFGLMVLQGSSPTTVAAPSGSVSIAPGQFALVGGKMDGAPKVLTVDVGQVFRSSPLVNSFPEPLPTKGAILSTAIQQQGSQSSGGLRSTGTTGVALTSGGDLLTGGSKPAKSGGYTFEIASNTPGTGRQEKQATATEKTRDEPTRDELDIATAAGGPTVGGPLPVTGSTGRGGGGGGGVNVPSIPSTPSITGQSGITANPNNPNNQNNQNNLPATVVNAQVQSKTYDGLVSAMIQNALLSGIQSGDSVALQNDTTGIFANKNVGTWSVSTTMGLTGADASRYILTQPTMSGAITAKDVTIATGTAFGKVYDGNTGATVTAGGLSGLVTGEILGTSTAVGTFASKDVGTRNVTAVYTLTDGANLASNYNLLNPTETLSATITAKGLTMTGSTAATKFYDGNTSASVTLGALSGEVVGETLGTSTAVGAFNSKDVLAANTVTAVYTLTDGLNGELASNYSLANDTLASTITAKSLTMTGSTAATKVYDGNRTASVTLGTLSGEVVGETLGTSTVVGTFNSKDVVGANTVTAVYTLVDGANGELASNYSLANDSLASTITAKSLTMAGSTAATKVYDGNRSASVTLGALSGEVAGEILGASTVVGTFNSKDVLAANTVTAVYTLTDGLNGELASNYSLANDTLASTITAKSLTMTGSTAATKVYDGNRTASVTLGTLSGEVVGETLGTSTVVGTFNSKDVVGANTVTAVYTLVDGVNGELASNYSLANDSLASTITAKTLTMTGSTAGSKVYDGNTTASVTLGALSGEVVGETLGTSTVVGTFNSKDVLAANTVTAVYTLTDGLNGELASNYSLANDGLASTITAKALTMTGSTAATKVYDGNTTASVTLGALSGEVAGETLGTSTAVGTFNSKDVVGANTVTAVYTLVDGANGELASNYSLANDSLASTITAKALTMTGSTAATKVYDGNRTASVTLGALSGEVFGETLGTSTVVGAFNSKDVLSANTVTAVYTLVDGANGELASNYSLANDTLASTITAKALTMTGSTAASKVYDGNTTASVTLGTLSGEVAGETLGTSTVLGTFNSKDVLSANTVTAAYTLVDGVNGELASNYSLANDSLASTITAKALTMTGSSAATKVYNGNASAAVTLGALSGEVAGETLGATTVVGTFTDKNIGTKNVAAVYTLVNGSNGELASNYSLAGETLTGTITAKDLSVFSAAVTTKVYDGNDAAVVTGAVLVGNSTTDIDGKFIGTETVTLNGGTAGIFASKNVGVGQGVTTTMTLGGSDAGNYTLNTQPTLSGTITAKALTISVATPSTVASKVYNGSRDAAVTVGALDGEVAGETLGATTVVGTFADKNIGTKNVAAVYTLVNGLNGELASNYTLAGETLTGTITAKDLSVFSAAVTTKVYDGNDTAVVTGAVLVGNSTSDIDGKFIGTETVTLNGGTAGTFASKNVGAGQGVTTTMTLGGSDAGNYTLNTQPTLNGTITAKALTISVSTPSTVASKVYNGTRDAAVTVGALDGEVAGETLGTTTVVGTFADKNIGTKNVAAVYTLVNGSNGELASNYSLAGETLTGTITAKDLSVFSAAVTTKVYDGNDTAVVTGAVLVGNSTSDIDGKFIGTETVTLNGGTAGTFASKNVGAGQGVTTTMTLGGADAGNYTLNTQPTLNGTITAKALTISVATPSTVTSKVYNGTRNAAVTVGALDGEVAGETLGTPTVVGTFADKNIGTKNVAAVYTLVNGSNGELASNYSLASETLTGTITAKDLSVFSAAVTTKAYDGNDAAVVTGAMLVGNSTSDIDGKFIGTETVTLNGGTAGTFASKNVGAGQGVTTTMTLGGVDAGNYTLNTQPTLNGTITAKALTISVATPSTVTSKVYTGTRDAAVTVGTLDGLVGAEVLGATTVVGTFADKNIGTKNVAAVYTLVNGSNGELASNYSLAAETLTGTITAKDLSVFSAAVTTKVYDGNDAAVVTGAVLVGNSTTDIDGKFIGTETVTLNGGTAGTFASKNVGAGQAVATTMTLGGVDAGNYTLNTQPTLNGTITAKALTMTGSSAPSKVYDGNRSASVTLGALSGEVAGESLGASTVVGTFNSKDVLSANTVTAVYTLVDGANAELASNYSLANDNLASTITAKSLSISAPSIGSKAYDGLATAGSLTLGTLSGFVGSETVTASGAAADYSSANVGTYNGVAVSYTLSNGSNGGLASNYSLAAGSATGVITAKDVTIASGSVSGKVYDGNTGAVVTAGSLSGLVLGESLGTTTAVGTFASKDVGTRNVAASYTLTDGANLAANYNLLNPTETLSAAITAKGLSVTAPSIASKKYDGTTAAGVVTVGTLSGFVGTETVTAAGSAANYSSANVGSYSSAVSYTLSDGSNGGLASNYSLAAGSATGAISAKDLVVNAAGITVGKVYDGGTSINPATQVAIGSGSLTGNSTSANDGNYIGTEAVSLAVDAAGTFERNLPGTMIPISTTVKLASGNAVNNNYSLRAQPSGLTGEITGTANLNQNGVGISVSSADYIHIRNTTATRMQDGLTISSATGSVLLENSSFDGWMQRSTPNQTISDGGATTFTFTESAATAVNSPVLRVKMEANDPANVDMNKQYMLLGDYQVLLRRDPNGAPGSGDEVATTLFSFPGSADDPNGFGSMAPSADLVIRDSATTQVKDLPWNTKEYSSLNGSGAAVDSGNYAAVQGEFKGDNAASALDIATSSGGAAGNWDVMVSDPSLGGEGKVTDVRLKYNNNTKALIQGPNGVRLVNVIFEGMDEVEVGAGLNDKVLMSGTLVSDPNIGKMVVKAGQTLEAQFASDATMKDVRTSAGNAEILAGVVKDSASPTGYSFISGPNRVLEMQSATIAGQLSLASHTIVFNNANITSGGVIDARTRDGMVNRSYGSVVPGTVSFMGANGNTFLNTANSASMSIANSGNIVSALSGGQMSENGAGGATVMNVGRVR